MTIFGIVAFSTHLWGNLSMEHRPSFYGIRLFLFLGIFSIHYDRNLWIGAFGLSLFLVMSGFLITKLILVSEPFGKKKVLKSFYIRRALRVFPLYYGYSILMLIFGMLYFKQSTFLMIANFDLALSFGQGKMAPPSDVLFLGTHLWSISLEEQFYLLFPLFLLLVKPKFRTSFISLIILSSIGMRYWFFKSDEYYFYGVFPPIGGEYIFWGCLFAQLDQTSIKNRVNMTTLLYSSIVLFILALLCLGPTPQPLYFIIRPDHHYQSFAGILFGAIIWGLWNCKGCLIDRILSLKPFVYLGRISYGLYVFHLTAIYLVVYRLELSGHFGFWISLLLTIIVSSISFHCLEFPIMNWSHRFKYKN